MDMPPPRMDFKSKHRVRVAIVGGGIAGLACAKSLGQRGADVTVFEAASAGQGALWASGGMLAGGFECAESRASPAFAALAKRGMALWSGWAEELGVAEIGYRVGGVVCPAANAAGHAWLDGLVDRAEALDIPIQGIRAISDGLHASRTICFPGDGELDNRLLGPRLVAFLREAAVTIHENCFVERLSAKGDGLRVEATTGSNNFDHVILATGNAGNEFAKIEPSLSAIRPVKGQMLSLEGQGLNILFCLRAQNAYVSQKADGRFVIGATSEPGQNDLDVDAAAIAELRAKAESWLPALGGMSLRESWAGIRPGTLDDMPILGRGAQDGVHLALGLYRNGVLIAPAVGEMIADAVLNGAALPAEFAASRFDQR